MSKAVITPSGNHYSPESSDDSGLSLMVSFLTDELGCYNFERGQMLLKWALSSDQNDQGGNIAYLERDGDYIILEIGYIEGELLKVHRKNLAEIIKKWMEYCKTRPKKITLTREGDEIRIKAA